MPNTIRIKRRATGNAGAPSSLQNAELAYNEVDDVLYYGKGTGGAGGTATTVDAIGGSGAFLTLAGTQTVSGNKTFTGTVSLGSNATASTQATGDNSTKLATTAFVKAQSYLTANQPISVIGDATGSGSTSITLTLANSGVTAGTYPKVTVDAKGRVTGGASLAASDIPSLTASKISDFDTQVRTSRLDQMAAPTTVVSLNSQRLTNVGAPTADTDAVNKAYVDAARSGLDVKQSVRVATTANITLSGTQTIDGVAVVAGDRVLVKDQTTASANGIYVCAAGAWTRATDADSDAEVTSGMFCFVEMGTANADSGWVLITDGAITVGTTSLAFAQFSGAGQISAGDGLGSSGNTLSVNVDNSTIEISSDALRVKDLGITAAKLAAGAVTAAKLATSAVDLSQTTVTGTLPVSKGGSGATTLTGVLKGNGTGAFTAAVGTDINSTFGSQTASAVYAAPTGVAGAPTFRQLVASDIPTLATKDSPVFSGAWQHNGTSFSVTTTGSVGFDASTSCRISTASLVLSLGAVSFVNDSAATFLTALGAIDGGTF